MKTRLSVVILLIGIFAATARAQDRLHGQALQHAVQERTFVFYARTALPLQGRMINLTDLTYTLKVMPDSLYADLPYFGKAYAAPANFSGGGIHIQSATYRYQLSHKKSGWHLVLFPTGDVDVYRMDLDISTEGYSSLYIIPNQREAISYSGIISK